MKVPSIEKLICPNCHKRVINKSEKKLWEQYRYEEEKDGTLIIMCGHCKSWFQYNDETGEWEKCEIDTSVPLEPIDPRWPVPPTPRLIYPFPKKKRKVKPSTLEVRGWLRTNTNRSPLAANRFKDSNEATNFVDRLYEAGAVKVEVDDVEKETSGYYTDTLKVTMPSEFKKRKALFKIFSEETEREGFGPEEDKGQNEFILWWD